MPPQASRRIGWTAGFILVFISAFFLSGTQQPPLELDPSWHTAIEFATEHHLQFGTEIVFTFGPLGFLSARTSLGGLVGLRVAFAIFWSTILALVAVDIARRLRGWLRYAFLVWLMVFTLSSGIDQAAFLVLACATILLIQDDPRERWQFPLFVIAFVVLSLIKFTFSTAALVSIFLVVVCWSRERKIRKATALAFAAPVGFAVCWAALGQSPSHIVPWFLHGLELASWYSGAMNLVPKTSVLWAALVALLLFVCAFTTTIARARNNISTWGIWITLGQYVFLAWKEGFTRAGDWHTFVFLWFLPLGLALCFIVELPGAPVKLRKRLLEIIFAAAMILCLVAANFQIPRFPGQLIVAWPRRMMDNTSIILATITGRARDLYAGSRDAGANPMLDLERAKDVIGQDSVDVMNYLLLAAVVNGMNYRPRPVIQGFVAYTPLLQRLNADYFQSAARPRYVLLAHQATDGRFPMLEDSAALNFVFNNYVPVARDGGFLILQQRTAQHVEFQLVHEGNLLFGEKFDLTPWNRGPLFMSAEIVPPLLGQVRDFLYQQPPVSMRIESGGDAERFRIVPSMAELPFLISPILKGNFDVLNFLASQTGSQVENLTFEPPDRGAFDFAPHIRVRLYRAPEFPFAAKEVPASRILADVRGRVFWPEPQIVESASPARMTMTQGAPALMVRGPSRVVLQVPENASQFSGYLGVPEWAGEFPGGLQELELTISVADQSGHDRQVFKRSLHAENLARDGGRFLFHIPIESPNDRTVTLVTSPKPVGSAKGGWSFWSQCRFDVTKAP